MAKNENLQKNIRHEKVVLEKKGDHVEISGNYTKRELRQLLLSPTVSPLLSDDEDRTKLEKTLETGIKLSQIDIEKIRKDKIHDEIRKKGEEILKDHQVTIDHKDYKDIIGDVLKEEQYKDDETWQQIYKDTRATLDTEEKKKEERISMEKYLREKGLSTSLINSILNNGLTDEYIRLLKALNITDDEIEHIKSIYQMKLDDSSVSLIKSDESFISSSSSLASSDYYLSPDSLYLKTLLSKALTRALPEIASKKPYDPIEYLGHWLLHLKISEEQRNKKREFEIELMMEREKYKMMIVEDQETVSIESRGEEEFIEDANFINYINN
ncbi:uncharacterized protein LOC122629919 isoform X2 [Vespula pensylvanica]|uniref:uncharacterized protein LOC122629919 isoform X1 n=1 Tax=Vespula pensylvanica TaxID=30213 RepID=UPI001CBA49CA|nr:uncharacterized protein LOC122629919 isoform X1 [Vespula pensylvanica]XP_043669751.1 uncharacterized protein LOC122629919 isoform X2 [Vespula pensylvanica]XP_043669753.1 uncharacterized protein LOC122629919 isoform X2 [Vespula pensylvanica]XP_043669754.1 uncharacterized protein LOC122629919 isoform X2 [Vespula pensylvanica]XP_043669755.1 uncharacterized protein LOC122629919 isoform X2 [Vespula pensylvanica]XP_043669756.1 uncharacterized protein LOC122629919 isoform X2 [Vespula pensylvanica]